MKKENTKKDRTLMWAGFIIAGVVSVFLIFAFLIPVISAQNKLSDKLDGFLNMTENDLVQVFDPMYREGSFYGDVTAELGTDMVGELVQTLLYVCDGAKYSSTEKTIVGNWDISVVLRKDDGGIFSMYFAEEKFYIAIDNTQYYFSPADNRAGAYESFYEELCEMIRQKKSSEA